MGMCLGMYVSHKGLTIEAMQKLFPEHKEEMTFIQGQMPTVCIDVECSYSWGGVLQDRMWDYVNKASKDCVVKLQLSDFEEPDDYFIIQNGNIVKENVHNETFEDETDDECPECLDEDVEYDDLPADQKAFREAYNAHLFNKCRAMRNDADLDVFIERKECIEYICIHDMYDDSERNPIGSAWDIMEHTLHNDDKLMEYDAGCLWGYVSAVEAARGELGYIDVFRDGKPIAIYCAENTELAWQMTEDKSELTFAKAKEMLHGYPLYEMKGDGK